MVTHFLFSQVFLTVKNKSSTRAFAHFFKVKNPPKFSPQATKAT